MRLRILTFNAALILSQLITACAVPSLNDEYIASLFIKFNENKDRKGLLVSALETSGFVEAGREGNNILMQCAACNLGVFVYIHDVIYLNGLEDSVVAETIDVPNTLEGKLNLIVAMDEAGVSFDCEEIRSKFMAEVSQREKEEGIYRCYTSK